MGCSTMTERSRREKSSGGGSHSTPNHAPDSYTPEALPTADVVGDVLRLQRLVGNLAAQRMLRSQGHTPPKTTSILQRAPEENTGLRTEQQTDAFAQKIHDYVSNPANAAQPVSNLMEELRRAVDDALAAVDVVSVSLQFNADEDKFGEFMPKTWSIALPDKPFGAVDTVGAVPQDRLNELINTLYHESRHAEQNYRIYRMLAGEILQQSPDKSSETVAQEIDQSLRQSGAKVGIPPLPILQQAVSQPLIGGTEANDRLLQEAKLWHKTVFGVDKNYVALVHRLRADIGGLIDAVKVAQGASTDPSVAMQALNDKLNAFFTGSYVTEIQTETMRILAIPYMDKIPNDWTMLEHLVALRTGIDALDPLRPATPETLPAIAAALGVGDQQGLTEEVYAAIKDLPHEKDAWATGDAAEGALNAP